MARQHHERSVAALRPRNWQHSLAGEVEAVHYRLRHARGERGRPLARGRRKSHRARSGRAVRIPAGSSRGKTAAGNGDGSSRERTGRPLFGRLIPGENGLSGSRTAHPGSGRAIRSPAGSSREKTGCRKRERLIPGENELSPTRTAHPGRKRAVRILAEPSSRQAGRFLLRQPILFCASPSDGETRRCFRGEVKR